VTRLAFVASMLVALAVTQIARAEVIDMPPPPVDPDRGNFWRELLSPHKEEVDLIVTRARQALSTADMALYSDYDPTGLERTRFYKEVYGMLKYARTLAPDNLEVLRLLGQTADEHGKTREAIEALKAAIDLAGADKVGSDVTGRLGIIYVRLGKLDDAIRYLHAAEGPIIAGQPISAHVLVHLASALAARGQMTEAIDVLTNAIPAQLPYYTNELVVVSFALAVQYDRDEQRGAAFEILDRMQTILQGQLATMVQMQLGAIRFAPAEDRHYYNGLLYEAAGHYVEARAEWALYAAAGQLPYRRRALEHIAAIDALRRTEQPVASGPRVRPPPPPSRHPHPRQQP
jgi:tetratricopeptide (TPR) repeat protein